MLDRYRLRRKIRRTGQTKSKAKNLAHHCHQQVVKMNRYGFPRTAAGRIKRVHGTGDFFRLAQSKGKYASIHKGRLASI